MAEYDEPTVEQGGPISDSDELPLIKTLIAARSPYVGVANEEEMKQGAQAARYLREDALGKGGMGEVGLHRDRWIGREVAFKKMHDAKASDLARRRFLREVRVQGQLEHPSIVPLYDFGAGADGQLYFTMRRVHGATL
jgi:serine/threonine protein kinase